MSLARHRSELRLDPLVRRRSRVPGLSAPVFDLADFADALERHDVDSQLTWYASDAEIRVVDPESPPLAARLVRGEPAIRLWLGNPDAVGLEVTHLVDGGDRVAFTERWGRSDGTDVVATSTAELRGGLIASQHSVLAWGSRPIEPVDGWTRVSKDLWTRAD